MLQRSLVAAQYWARCGIYLETVVESTFPLIMQGSKPFIESVIAWPIETISFLDYVFAQACIYNHNTIYTRLTHYSLANTTYTFMGDYAMGIGNGSIIQAILGRPVRVTPRKRLLESIETSLCVLLHLTSAWRDYLFDDTIITAFIVTGHARSTFQFALTDPQVYQLYGAGVTEFYEYTDLIRWYMRDLPILIIATDDIIPRPLLHLIAGYCVHEIEPQYKQARRGLGGLRVGEMERDSYSFC